jgi:hypothetical protein
MSATKLIRWSGMALMLGGILFAAHEITHPPGETASTLSTHFGCHRTCSGELRVC